MFKLCVSSTYLISITIAFNYQFLSKLFKYVSEYYLLITYTYNYIYETESRPSLSFLVMHKVSSSHNMFFKLDYIIKILGMCIDCIFKIKACLSKL